MLNPFRMILRLLRWGFLSLLTLSLLVLLALVFAPQILCVESSQKEADVIIVLSGETPQRAGRCAEIYAKGYARYVIISGEGDGEFIRRRLIQARIPQENIYLEGESMNTWENAVMTSVLLKKMHVRRAFLLTSWFHTRRAVATFRHVAPEVEFHPIAAPFTWDLWDHPVKDRARALLREYTKCGWYFIRHGVWLV